MATRRRNVESSMSSQAATQAEPLIPQAIPPYLDINDSPPPSPPPPSAQRPTWANTTPSWIPIAAASGACAAFNGVFAKLTTTSLTTSWASHISTALSLSADNKPIAFALRAFFFLLNLVFNALMWTLFTMALTRGSSTTRVSLVNTSSNFLLTALSGLAVFGERLPPLWWVGAMGLVVGNVVIGRRDGGAEGKGKEEGIGLREDAGLGPEGTREDYRDQDEGDVEEEAVGRGRPEI